jgi:hypothetical protein
MLQSRDSSYLYLAASMHRLEGAGTLDRSYRSLSNNKNNNATAGAVQQQNRNNTITAAAAAAAAAKQPLEPCNKSCGERKVD